MKQLLFLILATLVLSFTTNDEKRETLSFTPAETDFVFGTLGASKQAILQSNLPVKDALQISAMIDSAQRLIAKQIQPQRPKK